MNNYTIMIMTILVLALFAVFDRKRHASRLVALALIFTFSLAVPARAGDWRTGYVPSGGGDTSAIVVFNNTNKNAYIRLHAYVQKGLIPRSAESNPEGKEGNCTLHVTMKDENDNFIWEGDVNTGSGARRGIKLKLGPDHRVYKIYLRHEYSIHCWEHKCPIYWGVETLSNASF